MKIDRYQLIELIKQGKVEALLTNRRSIDSVGQYVRSAYTLNEIIDLIEGDEVATDAFPCFTNYWYAYAHVLKHPKSRVYLLKLKESANEN